MDFHHLIRTYELLDIITVDGIHYAISSTNKHVPDCTVVLATQLHSYLPLFLRSGYSQKFRQQYSSLVGMQSWLLYSYSLTDFGATKKQTFSHALAGTGGRKGLLASWNGQKIGRSAFFVPLAYEKEVTEFFAHWHVPYTVEVVLRGE